MRAEPLRPVQKPSRLLNLRVLDEEMDQLKAVAQARGTTVSALVRGVIRQHLLASVSTERRAS